MKEAHSHLSGVGRQDEKIILTNPESALIRREVEAAL